MIGAAVKQARDNGICLNYVNFGERNPELRFYVIWRQEPGAGFFSNVFHVLGHATVATRLGMVPIVDMENFSTFYQEAAPVRGTKNAWEYYFRQPSNFSLSEVYHSKNVFFCDGNFVHDIYENVTEAHEASVKYLHPQAYFFEILEGLKSQYFDGKKVLGVHFRGQEHKTAPEHPRCPTEFQVKEKIDYILDRFTVDHIFVVTEEQAYLDFLVAEYGDRVVYTDAFRTYDENAYFLKAYPRDLHMYKLGLDVMVDTYLLSCSDYFVASGKDGVASGSNVSRMAQVLTNNFDHIECIFNGINPPRACDPLSTFARLNIFFKKVVKLARK